MISDTNSAIISTRSQIRLLGLWLFCMWGCSPAGLFAQQPAYFFLGEEQFDGVQIYDVIQDLQSNYWFATDEGIVKHDGYTFERLECENMVGQSVFGFVMDAQGTIFCHTLNHQIIRIRAGECSVIHELREDERSSDIHLSITPENALLIVARKALIIDQNGNLHRNPYPAGHYHGAPFQTRGGSIVSHIGSRDSLLEVRNNTFRQLPMRNVPLSSIGVLRFFRIKDAAYAIDATHKTLYAFDESDYSLQPIPAKSFLTATEHMRYYNENDQLWVAGPISGVRVLKDPLSQLTAEIFYPQHLISNVFQDRERNLLLSTFNDGVIVVPNLEIPDVLPIPGGQSVTGLQQDESLGILLGTSTGQLFAVEEGGFSLLSDAGTKPLEVIHAWPGHPLIVFDDGKIKAYDKITGAIHVIAQGALKDVVAPEEKNLYLALNTGVQKISWDGRSGFQQSHIDSLRIRCYAVEIDPGSKALYAATSDGLKSLRQDGSIQTIHFQGERVFATDMIHADGLLHVATKSQGILLLRNGSIVQHIEPKIAGKPLELSRIAMHAGKLYATTSAGFVGIEQDGTISTQLNKANGFSTNKIFNFAFDQDQLWLAHSKGVQRLQLTQLAQEKQVPLIFLTQVTVNDSPIRDIQSQGRFDSEQRKYRFQVSTPTLRHRENIVYHYKLLGYETTWSTAPYHDNSITYNALGPGQYTLLVKAENRGSVSEPVSYSFSISAPYYARWWFILLAGLSVLLIVTLIYRRQLRIQRKKAHILNALNVSRLTAIQSQMNPHFIFNALNSIQDLVLRGDIDNSYTYITKFANLIRRTLTYSDKDFIEFEHEIELLDLYLSLEKLRFKHDFQFSIEANDIEGIQVPPMLIQPFIENALVHGLIHKEGHKSLRIHFELEQTLVCTIEDNGIGREKAKEIKARQRAGQESFSENAIRKRFSILNEHFKGQFGFQFEDLHDGEAATGTKVTLHIPVRRMF